MVVGNNIIRISASRSPSDFLAATLTAQIAFTAVSASVFVSAAAAVPVLVLAFNSTFNTYYTITINLLIRMPLSYLLVASCSYGCGFGRTV
jgi:hypothetical protein